MILKVIKCLPLNVSFYKLFPDRIQFYGQKNTYRKWRYWLEII